jgi:hypothetical protein
MKAKIKMLSVLFVILFSVTAFSQSVNKMHSMKKDSAKTMHQMKLKKNSMMKSKNRMMEKKKTIITK